jgi:hypothetical protein
MLVDARVILLVEDNTMGQHLHPYIESGTLRAYTRMYTIDKSTKRWTLTSLKIDEPFGARFHFEKFRGNRCRQMRGSYSWLKITQWANIYIPI